MKSKDRHQPTLDTFDGNNSDSSNGNRGGLNRKERINHRDADLIFDAPSHKRGKTRSDHAHWSLWLLGIAMVVGAVWFFNPGSSPKPVREPINENIIQSIAEPDTVEKTTANERIAHATQPGGTPSTAMVEEETLPNQVVSDENQSADGSKTDTTMSAPAAAKAAEQSNRQANTTQTTDSKPSKESDDTSSTINTVEVAKTTPKENLTPAQPTPEELAEKAKQQALLQEKQRLAAEKARKEKALKSLITKADSGDIASQLKLADMYLNGTDVKKDIAESIRWLTAAATADNPEAQFRLSEHYWSGKGVQRNGLNALKWLTLAAENGLAQAQIKLADEYANGRNVPKDTLLELQWLNKAAQQNDVAAQKILAAKYEFGDGVPVNLETSLKWYRAAAAQGDSSSRLYISKLLEKAPQLNGAPLFEEAP